MERSDEARREDSLYDRIGSAERLNRKLEERIKELEVENEKQNDLLKTVTDVGDVARSIRAVKIFQALEGGD